jgi:hypothetical protein
VCVRARACACVDVCLCVWTWTYACDASLSTHVGHVTAGFRSWTMTYSGCPLNTSGDAAFGTHTPVVDLWEAVEGGGEGPAYTLNNSCGLGRTFIPFDGCGDELGRRCAPAWVHGDRAACTRCAMQANISLCGRCPRSPHSMTTAADGNKSECVPAAIKRWCQGWDNYTTGAHCNTAAGETAVYEDDIFANYAEERIREHNTTTPLLLFFALHAAHTPLQVQADVLSRFDFMMTREDKPERTRQVYAAMVSEADRVIGRLVSSFKQQGLWNNTLHICLSDNGGPSYLNGTSGANNYPLKGASLCLFEEGAHSTDTRR